MTLLSAVAAMTATTSGAATSPALEEITILGTREAVRELPGSGALVDSEQIALEAATDVNQLLKTVPGIYIREEEGYGLRPNIGIRGATSERSGKITLMEDGVLVAPAPYSNPSAYYFPTMSRMQGLEVLKGAPLLRYGPHTTGGVVNMVSTAIPSSMSGSVSAIYGQDNQRDLLAWIGGSAGDFGFLLETAQRRGDGFKKIDRSSHNTGYDIEDYVLKLSWEHGAHKLLFKSQYSEEVSDETYLGLTDADFSADSSRRYGISAIDQMVNDHLGFSLSYRLSFSENLSFSAKAYHNEFSRDWFKLSGGGGLVRAANTGDTNAQAILDGSADATDLTYKHNARDYLSTGIEGNLDISLGQHQLALGGRLHEDEMDRFQPVDYYNQVDGELIYQRTKAPSGSDNRVEDAEAVSLWATDTWSLSQALTLNLALRYEDVSSSRLQYGDADRVEIASRRSNDSAKWLPGASFTYDLSPSWQLLAGVHRGFSPLGGGAQDSEDPETSVNWEAGVRYRGDWFVEAIAFHSDFDNKSENCSNANPCSNGATSGSFITGEAVIKGIEFQLGTMLTLGKVNIPFDLMYTYTRAEISNDNPSEGFAEGDWLAAVPQNTFSLRTGIETSFGWDNYAVARFTDKLCVNVGCNRSDSPYAETESLFVVDLISRYMLSDNLVLFAKIENLLDEQAIVSRQPDGARPNKPRTALLGVQWNFE